MWLLDKDQQLQTSIFTTVAHGSSWFDKSVMEEVKLKSYYKVSFPLHRDGMLAQDTDIKSKFQTSKARALSLHAILEVLVEIKHAQTRTTVPTNLTIFNVLTAPKYHITSVGIYSFELLPPLSPQWVQSISSETFRTKKKYY